MARRLATHASGRATAVAFIALLAAVGLYAGVRIERGSGGSADASARAFAGSGFGRRVTGSGITGASSGSTGAARSGFGSAPGAFGAGAGVSGTVASIDGGIIDVTETDGPTVAVRLARGATVTKTAAHTTSATGLRAGDTVEFGGMSIGSGQFAATTVRDLGHIAVSTPSNSNLTSTTSLFGG